MHTENISSGIGISAIIGISAGGAITILLLILSLVVIGIKLCCGDASSKAMDAEGITACVCT